MESVSDRLRWARQEAGFSSARSAALNFGWGYEAYRKHEGGSPVPERPLEQYAKAYGVTKNWLRDGSAGLEKGIRVAVTTNIGAGSVILPSSDFPQGHGFAYMHIGDRVDPTNVVAAKISGESMKGESLDGYRHGDLVAGIRQSTDLESLVGQDCIVQLRTGEGYLKRLERGSQPGFWDLVSLTPGYERIKDAMLEWAAKVRWIDRR